MNKMPGIFLTFCAAKLLQVSIQFCIPCNTRHGRRIGWASVEETFLTDIMQWLRSVNPHYLSLDGYE